MGKFRAFERQLERGLNRIIAQKFIHAQFVKIIYLKECETKSNTGSGLELDFDVGRLTSKTE